MLEGTVGLVATIADGAPARQVLGRVVVDTRGQGLVEISDAVAGWIAGCGVQAGLLTLFCRHTSASLTIQENADPDVRIDLMTALDRIAPRDGGWVHRIEGPDDMPAHVRSMLTGASAAVPVVDGRLALGTWQGIYLVEHRDRPHRREIVLHLIGA